MLQFRQFLWLMVLAFLAAVVAGESVTSFKPSQWAGAIFIVPGQQNAEPKPVPLTAVDVYADIRGWTVGVTANLTYENHLEQNIECQFVFPLADTAAVYQLDAVVAGRRLSATVKERNQAETEYTQAVSGGRKAVLLESQVSSPDVYRLKLGNLPPNEVATIVVSYVQPIDHILDDGLLSVTLPVVLNPRYIPQHELNNSEIVKQNFHTSVPYVAVSDVQYDMTFSAKVTLGRSRSIVDIKARHPNDTLQVDYKAGKLSADVTLSGNFIQDHDFQLLITPSASLKPIIYVEPGQEPAIGAQLSWLNYDVAAAWFEPVKSSSSLTKKSTDEYWLVIDRSGSMSGTKISDAKSALTIFVKSLPFGCKFNIIGFGSTFEILFKKGVVDYSEESLKIAMAHADRLDADLGGTEILSPLQYIYQQTLRNDTTRARRFIVLLTDGEVSNTNEVIAIAQKNAATTRVFAIGIGEGASTALVNGVARVSNGLSEFVRSSQDRLQAKVISLLKATAEPSAVDIKLEWQMTGGKVKSTVPPELPSTVVYSGGSVTQYAVIEREPQKNVQGLAKFSAVYEGNFTESRLDFSIQSSRSSAVFSEPSDTMPLHRLSAKAVLTKLSDEFSRNRSAAIRQEAVAISIATGVLCEFTAFVAVDTDAPLSNATAQKPVFIDIERPTSYLNGEEEDSRSFSPGLPTIAKGVLGRRVSTTTTTTGRKARPTTTTTTTTAASYAGYDTGYNADMLTTSSDQPTQATTEFDFSTTTTTTSTKMVASTPRQQYEQLIRLQTFDGSWLLTSDLVAIVNRSNVTSFDALRKLILEIIKVNLPTAVSTKLASNDQFIATSTAVSLLHHRFSAYKIEWQLIESKAVYFLRSTGFSGDVDRLASAIATKLAL